MLFPRYYITFSILTICAFSSGSSLDSMDFKEKNCSSMCDIGMIIETDKCTFTCLVFLKGFPMDSFVTFLLRRKADRFATEIFSLEPYNDCERFVNKIPYTCTIINDTVYSISVLLNTSIDYSEAEITCKLHDPGLKITERKFQNMPKIFEFRKATGILKINGNNMSSENCFTLLPERNLTLEFDCFTWAKSCSIEIMLNESTQDVYGLDRVVYNHTLNNDALVSIKFGACRLNELYNVINCTIKTGLNKMTASNMSNDNSKNLIIVLVSCSIVLVIIIAIIGLTIKLSFLRLKEREKSLKTQENEQKESLLETILSQSKIPTNETLPKNHVLYKTESGKDDQQSKDITCPNDHPSFKELRTLTKDQINEDDDEQLYSLIKAMGNLTVKLEVRDTQNVIIKTGTGWVEGVIKHHKKHGKKCKCCKYNTSNQRGETSKCNSEWRELLVYTSTHLVSDENEAKRTTYILFYDIDEDKKVDFFVEEKNHKECGTFLIKHVTCDKNLVKLLDKLHNMHKNWEQLNKKVNEKYREFKHFKKDVYIVSHVYGGRKMLSEGKWTEREVINQMDGFVELTRYTYTAQAGPGSTGAYVFIPGRDHRMWTSHHIHCGVNAEGRNFSSFAIDWT